MTVCHSLISCFWKTTRAMQASYSQGLTCIKSHNTNPYKSPKHPKTTEKKCSSFTNMHDWPALIWQRPRKATPSWTENRECPRLKVMLIIETNNDTSGQLSIYTYTQIQMVVSTLVNTSYVKVKNQGNMTMTFVARLESMDDLESRIIL